jgi:hypothetical protein
VYELVDELKNGAAAEIDLVSGRTALNVLEELKVQNEQLSSRLEVANNQLLSFAQSRLRGRFLVAMAAIFVYLSVVLSASGIAAGGKPFVKFFYDAFITPWPFHLAFAGLVATILSAPWSKFFPRVNLGALGND